MTLLKISTLALALLSRSAPPQVLASAFSTEIRRLRDEDSAPGSAASDGGLSDDGEGAAAAAGVEAKVEYGNPSFPWREGCSSRVSEARGGKYSGQSSALAVFEGIYCVNREKKEQEQDTICKFFLWLCEVFLFFIVRMTPCPVGSTCPYKKEVSVERLPFPVLLFFQHNNYCQWSGDVRGN